jgi:hypothetical protein
MSRKQKAIVLYKYSSKTLLNDFLPILSFSIRPYQIFREKKKSFKIFQREQF